MEMGMNTLVNELKQGHQLARELEAQLNPGSVELCKSLVQDILSSIGKAMSMAKSSACSSLATGADDSARSFAGRSVSENSEQPFRAERKEMISKKRKTQPKSTSQVKLGSGPEAEGPLDDGYSWRKYGQKQILGANHPRGYYRCTHRNSQGCPAMKQVQRSDDNLSIFEVTYRGSHTCHQKSSPPMAATSSFPSLDHHHNQLLLLSFQSNLKVETGNLDSKSPETSFSFPPTSIDGMQPDSHVFSPASTLDNCIKRSFTEAFISPTTPESNYFSGSPCRMSSYGPNRQASESDLTEIVSAATSPSNSSMLELDFPFQSTDLDAEFPFDISSFFS